MRQSLFRNREGVETFPYDADNPSVTCGDTSTTESYIQTRQKNSECEIFAEKGLSIHQEVSQNDETDWQCILRARTHGETVARIMADGNPNVFTVEWIL